MTFATNCLLFCETPSSTVFSFHSDRIAVFLDITTPNAPQQKAKWDSLHNECSLLVTLRKNAKSEHKKVFKIYPEDMRSQNSLVLVVPICQVQCVRLDAFNSGRGNSRWPFGGSWSGTNGLRGVRLIRLYCAVMIACRNKAPLLPLSFFTPLWLQTNQGPLKHVFLAPVVLCSRK